MAQFIFHPLVLLCALLLIASSAAQSTFAAVGISVESLPKSQQFYTDVLGLKPSGGFIRTALFDEVIMQLPGPKPGSAIVLVQYKEPKQNKNLPIKLVFYVDDVKATVEKIRTAGGKIDNEPGSIKIANRTLPTAMTRDLDGYAIELNPLTSLGKSLST
jgi:catechol 2,3-dioxygenase-like lactoylglutathione lyase family enzyme